MHQPIDDLLVASSRIITVQALLPYRSYYSFLNSNDARVRSLLTEGMEKKHFVVTMLLATDEMRRGITPGETEVGNKIMTALDDGGGDDDEDYDPDDERPMSSAPSPTRHHSNSHPSDTATSGGRKKASKGAAARRNKHSLFSGGNGIDNNDNDPPEHALVTDPHHHKALLLTYADALRQFEDHQQYQHSAHIADLEHLYDALLFIKAEFKDGYRRYKKDRLRIPCYYDDALLAKPPPPPSSSTNEKNTNNTYDNNFNFIGDNNNNSSSNRGLPPLPAEKESLAFLEDLLPGQQFEPMSPNNRSSNDSDKNTKRKSSHRREEAKVALRDGPEHEHHLQEQQPSSPAPPPNPGMFEEAPALASALKRETVHNVNLSSIYSHRRVQAQAEGKSAVVNPDTNTAKLANTQFYRADGAFSPSPPRATSKAATAIGAGAGGGMVHFESPEQYKINRREALRRVEAFEREYTWADFHTFLQWSSEGIGAPPVTITEEEKSTVSLVIDQYENQGSIVRDDFVEDFVSVRINRIVETIFGVSAATTTAATTVTTTATTDKGKGRTSKTNNGLCSGASSVVDGRGVGSLTGGFGDVLANEKTGGDSAVISVTDLVKILDNVRRAQYGLKLDIEDDDEGEADDDKDDDYNNDNENSKDHDAVGNGAENDFSEHQPKPTSDRKSGDHTSPKIPPEDALRSPKPLSLQFDANKTTVADGLAGLVGLNSNSKNVLNLKKTEAEILADVAFYPIGFPQYIIRDLKHRQQKVNRFNKQLAAAATAANALSHVGTPAVANTPRGGAAERDFAEAMEAANNGGGVNEAAAAGVGGGISLAAVAALSRLGIDFGNTTTMDDALLGTLVANPSNAPSAVATSALQLEEYYIDRETLRKSITNAHAVWAAKKSKGDADVQSGRSKLKDLTLYLFPDEEMSPQVVRRLLKMIEIRPDMNTFTTHYSAQKAQKSRDVRDLFIFLPLVVLFIIVAFAGRGIWSGEFDGYGILNAYQSARDDLAFPKCEIVHDDEENGTNSSISTNNSHTNASIANYRWVCDEDDTKNLASVNSRADVVSILGSFIPMMLWPAEGQSAASTKVASALTPIGALRVRQKRVDEVHNDRSISLGFDLPSFPPLSRSLGTETYAWHETLVGNPVILNYTVVDHGGPLGDPHLGNLEDFGGRRYRSCGDLQSSIFSLLKGITRTYACGGYAVDIPFSVTKEEYEAVAAELVEKQWIDEATRILVLEYFLFHQNSGMVLQVKHLLELHAGGGVSQGVSTAPFFLEVRSANESRTFVAYVLFVIFLFFFGLRLVHRVYVSAGNDRTRLRWVGDALELANFGIFIFSLATYRGITLKSLDSIDPIWQLEHYPREYETMLAWYDISVIVNCVNIVLSFMLALMYTQHMMGFATIVRTLQRAIRPGVALAFVAIMILVGFAVCAACAFGQTIIGYHTVGDSILTLLAVFWDGWDYASVYTMDQRAFGYVFILVFNTFFVLFLLNAVVAVFADAFSDEGEAQFDPTDLHAIAAGDYFATLRRNFNVGYTAKLPLYIIHGFFSTLFGSLAKSLSTVDCLGITTPVIQYNYYNYHTLLHDDLKRLKDVSEGRSHDFTGAIRSAVRLLKKMEVVVNCVPEMETAEGFFKGRQCVYEFCRRTIFLTENGNDDIDYNLVMLFYVVVPQFAFGTNAMSEIVEAATAHKLWWEAVEEATIIADNEEEMHITSIINNSLRKVLEEDEDDLPLEEDDVDLEKVSSGAHSSTFSPIDEEGNDGNERRHGEHEEPTALSHHIASSRAGGHLASRITHFGASSTASPLANGGVSPPPTLQIFGFHQYSTLPHGHGHGAHNAALFHQTTADLLRAAENEEHSGDGGGGEEETESDSELAEATLNNINHFHRRTLLGILGAYFITSSGEGIDLIEKEELDSGATSVTAAETVAKTTKELISVKISTRDRLSFSNFNHIVSTLKAMGKLPRYFKAKDLWEESDMDHIFAEEWRKAREEDESDDDEGDDINNNNNNDGENNGEATDEKDSPRSKFSDKGDQKDDGEEEEMPSGLLIRDLIPLIQMEFTTQCLGLSFTLDEALEFSKHARRLANFMSPTPDRPRNFLDVTEFSDAWMAAKGRAPSAKLLKHICSIFPQDKIQWQLFAHACQADPMSPDAMCFPTSLASQLSRNRTNAMSYLIYIPTLVVYFVYLIFNTQGEAIHMSQSLRDTFSPSEPAPDRKRVEDFLRSTLSNMWEEDEGPGPRIHSESNFFVGALRVMQWRVAPVEKRLCEKLYEVYFGELNKVGHLRFPHELSVSENLKTFYNERVANDFPGVFDMECVENWNYGANEAHEFVLSRRNISNISSLDPIVQNAFVHRSFSTATRLSTTHGHDGMYGAKGFFFDIPFSMPFSEASELLETVLSHEWIDLRTRMVVVRSVSYNHNLKMAATMRIGFEVSSGGNMAPVSHVDILALRRSNDVSLDVTTVMVLVFAILYGARIIQETYILAKRRLRLQSSIHVNVISVFRDEFMTWMGILVHTLFVAVLLLTTTWRIIWWGHGSLPEEITIENNGIYPEAVEYNCLLSGVVRAMEGTNYLVLTILCTIFITASLRFEVILETISVAYGDLLAIGTLFFMVVIAFSCATQLLWGYDLDSVFSFGNTFIFMYIGATGGGGIPEDAFDSRPSTAPIFQIIYVVISSIILCNTVTGVLTDALSKVKEGKYDPRLANACLRMYGGAPGGQPTPKRWRHIFARWCRSLYELLILRSLIGSFIHILTNVFRFGTLRTSVKEHFAFSIHAYWSAMEKWWLMLDCGTPSEAAYAGANLIATLSIDEVREGMQRRDEAVNALVNLSEQKELERKRDRFLQSLTSIRRSLSERLGVFLFEKKPAKNNFVLYGPYRRLPVWEELLFNRFQQRDKSSTYSTLVDFFITVPKILYGQDEEQMGLDALEEKHYYDAQQQAFGAHLKGAEGEED